MGRDFSQKWEVRIMERIQQVSRVPARMQGRAEPGMKETFGNAGEAPLVPGEAPSGVSLRTEAGKKER